RHVGERIAGIEGIVADKLPRRTVKLVGARLGYHADHSAHGPAILNSVVVALDFEFLDRVDDGKHAVYRAAQIGVDEAIEIVKRGTVRLSLHRRLGEAGVGDSGNSRILEANP